MVFLLSPCYWLVQTSRLCRPLYILLFSLLLWLSTLLNVTAGSTRCLHKGGKCLSAAAVFIWYSCVSYSAGPIVVRIYVTPQKTNCSPLRCRCHHCVVSVQICMRPMPVLVPLLFRCPDVKNILQSYRFSLLLLNSRQH